MANNYLQILQELENSGAGEKRDIAKLLLQLFPKPNSIQDYDVETAKKPAITLLTDLAANNHILYNNSALHSIGVREDKGEHWFTNPFEVSITTLGLQYLHSKILHESILESNKISSATNKAIEKSIPFQKVLSVLTFSIAVLTGWISYLTYQPTKANQAQEKRLQSLEENVQRIIDTQSRDTTLKSPNIVKKK